MKCCVCGSKGSIFEFYRGKYCFICPDCLNKMPECVRQSLTSLKAKDLKELAALFQPSIDNLIWKKYGKIGISNEHLHIDEFQTPFSGVHAAELTFIQREQCRPETGGYWSVYGDVCIMLTFSHFRIMTLVSSTRILLAIQDVYPEFLVTKPSQVLFPEDARILTMLINAAAQIDNHSLAGYREQFFSGGSKTYGRKRQNSEEWQRQNRRTDDRRRTERPDILREALNYYNLSIPFSEQTLKKKRKELILRCHPDQIIKDGALCPEDVNRFFDVLKPYAEKEGRGK